MSWDDLVCFVLVRSYGIPGKKFRAGLSPLRYLNEGYDPTISIVFEMMEGVNEAEPHMHYW
jgi:hypothetical protein